jgi:RNA polymerase sigma-70 factor (ECF subfamily)
VDITMSSVAAQAFLTAAVGVSGEGRDASSALAALVERARTGDAHAFDRLMLETQERVLGVAWRLLGSREDARDAAQETYVRVYRHLGRFDARQDLMGWIYSIAVNVCRDAARRRRRSPLVAMEAPEGVEQARAEESLLARERRACVRQALAALPEKERAALVLRDLEGLTSEEVARVLGSRPGTVRARIASARAKVRAHCERVFGEAGGGTR